MVIQHASDQPQHQRDQNAPPLQQTPSKADVRADARRSEGGRGGGGGGGGGGVADGRAATDVRGADGRGGGSSSAGGGSYSSNHKRRSRIHDLPMPPMGKEDEEMSPPPENDSAVR